MASEPQRISTGRWMALGIAGLTVTLGAASLLFLMITK
jgi:hypothetical protein